MKKHWIFTWALAISFAGACGNVPEAVDEEAEPTVIAEETAAPSATDDQAASAGSAAQSGQPPAAQGAKPRLIAPIRGVAQVSYTKPVVKRGKVGGKDFVITTIQIKNMATGPIAGLKVDDFWYDRAGGPLPSDSYRHPRPLQPGEVITVTLETPADPRMNRNQWQFSHANGEIKPTLVPKL
jgi:hypothetical protein